MRLREIYVSCKRGYEEIFGQYKIIMDLYAEIKSTPNTEAAIYNRPKFNSRIKKLILTANKAMGDVECLQPVIAQINDAVSTDISDELKMRLIDVLVARIQCIVQLYESMGLNDEGNLGLNIKIPKTDSITDFKKCIDGLEFVFTKCPFFQSDEASWRFNAVDVGSIWLIIDAIGIAKAVSIILMGVAVFVDACYIIKSHKLTCERQEQEIRKANRAQKEKEELIESIHRVYNVEVENVIKELAESTGHQISDGDEMGRTEQSFDRIIKLLDKGLQIYASIDAPEEVKAVFAPLEMHYLSAGEELKKIEETAKSKNE